MTTQSLYATDPVVRIDFSADGVSTSNIYGNGFTTDVSSSPSPADYLGPIRWVLSGGTLTEGQVVVLTTTAATGVVTATALDTTGSGAVLNDVGIVHKAIASGSYGWVFVGPFTNVEVLTTTGITAGTQLTTHTVAGTASTGGDAIFGLTPIETTVAGLSQCQAIGKLGTNI